MGIVLMSVLAKEMAEKARTCAKAQGISLIEIAFRGREVENYNSLDVEFLEKETYAISF